MNSVSLLLYRIHPLLLPVFPTLQNSGRPSIPSPPLWQPMAGHPSSSPTHPLAYSAPQPLHPTSSPLPSAASGASGLAIGPRGRRQDKEEAGIVVISLPQAGVFVDDNGALGDTTGVSVTLGAQGEDAVAGRNYKGAAAGPATPAHQVLYQLPERNTSPLHERNTSPLQGPDACMIQS